MEKSLIHLQNTFHYTIFRDSYFFVLHFCQDFFFKIEHTLIYLVYYILTPMKDSPKSICCSLSCAFFCIAIVFVILRYATQNDEAGGIALILLCFGCLTCAITISVPDTFDIKKKSKVHPITV